MNKYYDKIMQKKPEFALDYITQGDMCMTKEHFQKAIDYYTKLRLEDYGGRYIENIIKCFKKLGKIYKIKSFVTKCLQEGRLCKLD